jgi:tetratricopeptide (TPR) repeat protein
MNQDVRMVGPRDGEWDFEHSPRMEGVLNELDDIIERIPDSPTKAEKSLLRVIQGAPYAFDAYSNLAYILWEWRQPADAIGLLRRGLGRANELFPPGFTLGKSRLSWGITDNRPFLRMYASLGVRCHDAGDLSSAKKILEDMLQMNPDDNQGMRELLCSCYFGLGDVKSVLKLCARFEDDSTPAIAFGRVLALLGSGRTDEAKEALFTAAKYGGNIATEIMKSKHDPVRAKDLGYYVVRVSAQEARLYWKEFGRYWKGTPGAVKFVRDQAHKGEDGSETDP